MFLTLMGWTLVTLSLCRPVWTAAKVTQPYRVTSISGTAQVQCFIQPQPFYLQQTQPSDYSDPEEVRVTLLRGLHGSQGLCSTTLNFPEPRETSVEEVGEVGEVQCSAEVTGGAVQVTVSGLKAADTDLYRCQIQVLYPPPYRRLIGNGTLIHVPDNCDAPVQEMVQQSDEEEGEEGEEEKEPVSAPVVVLVILVMFVLIIIIYLQTLQCERGKKELVVPAPAAGSC
ncbi:cytotoxic T-lymphocyte protein 4 isoform X1 [Pleuronectes platessa]|uniref:cytotoxic T-lymphocyte protein 4 isoform X1 n=1 Tax=Pleuronectes platessa TaxID=8262 RepID=UPI00232A252E|nr:cytotoxic T-lymphocyte protein 4 isoform X1 [Pleuronectes platessa]XP_053295912.1 cytotoxic T-lymphocyte protein 4 isoform X1 [Pleuronectes platessa]XP_053295913.1 cytotoxic T-lymphocyte protein 4 isoform X1 [Pleuronectes platessa]